jgi:hypothetical protein
MALTNCLFADRLLSNPYAQPPLPSDWEVRPTYPVHAVPYYLAPLWDAGLAARNAEKKRKEKSEKKGAAADEAAGKVPRELREKLKRSRGAKGLLQDLEEEVRKFVEKWEEKEAKMEQEGLVDPDSEDDEIVFVGRNGQMNDMRSPRSSGEIEREKLLFHSPVDDHGASFGWVSESFFPLWIFLIERPSSSGIHRYSYPHRWGRRASDYQIQLLNL